MAGAVARPVSTPPCGLSDTRTFLMAKPTCTASPFDTLKDSETKVTGNILAIDVPDRPVGVDKAHIDPDDRHTVIHGVQYIPGDYIYSLILFRRTPTAHLDVQ